MAKRHRPVTGEPRKQRKPLLLDRDPAAQQLILKRRALGDTWEEIASRLARAAGEELTPSTVQKWVKRARRWYDLRHEQVQGEVREQQRRAERVVGLFAGKSFDELPAATVEALKAEVFGLLGEQSAAGRQASLGNLLFLLTRLIDANAKARRAETEERKLKLAEKKFEDVRAKATKELDAAEAKLGKGKELTVEDINRIRRKVFGLGPAPGSPA